MSEFLLTVSGLSLSLVGVVGGLIHPEMFVVAFMGMILILSKNFILEKQNKYYKRY